MKFCHPRNFLIYYRHRDDKKNQDKHTKNKTKQQTKNRPLLKYLWTWVRLKKNSFSMVFLEKGTTIAIIKLKTVLLISNKINNS